MRILALLLVLLVVALQYRLWVGDGSLAELRGIQREIAEQKAELDRLAARNRELQAEVDDLRTGQEALEERARGDLGMIEPGEIFLQVIERQPKKPATK